jgi:hypothetical protein
MQLKRSELRVTPVVDMFLLMLLSISSFVYMDSWNFVDCFDLLKLKRRFEVF